MKRVLDRAGSRISEEELIRFDWRVMLLGAAVLLAFMLFVILRLNASSIAMWNSYVPPAPAADTGLLAGTPRASRSDEWLRSTPYLLSQYQLGFPVDNPDIGAGSDSLILSLPAAHFSMLFRPQNWGYFALGLERGFAFFWGFKIFGLFFSSFLLLMLLTRNHFWLSLFGSVWLFFSGFIQWWFSATALMLVCVNIMFIALAYVFLSKRPAAAVLGAAAFAVFAVNFVLLFYPAFQVVLVYLLLFLLAGFLVGKRRRLILWANLRRRLPLLTGAALLALVALLLFYRDTRQTIALIAGTVYPGSRISTGGGIGLARIFSGFTDVPLGELRFPAEWGNASEASNFILLFPAVFLAAGHNLLRRIRGNALVISLAAYLVLMLVFAAAGFPGWLARLTLMSEVPPSRSLLGLGVGSVLLTIIFLSDGGARPRLRFALAGAALALAALLLYGHELRAAAGDFFGMKYVIVIAVTFAVLTFLLLGRRLVLFSLAVLLILIPFYRVNPISAGLGSIYGKDLEQAALAMKQRQPQSKWVVYGNYVMANYLLASGLEVENGTKYTPDFRFLDYLDPGHKYEDVYNRTANITFTRPRPAAPGEATAATAVLARFRLTNEDSYGIELDPCSPQLEAAGVNYFAFYQEPAGGLSCLEPIQDFPESGVSFYVRK